MLAKSDTILLLKFYIIDVSPVKIHMRLMKHLLSFDKKRNGTNYVFSTQKCLWNSIRLFVNQDYLFIYTWLQFGLFTFEISSMHVCGQHTYIYTVQGKNLPVF